MTRVNTGNGGHYAFGEGNLAALRLAKVAEVFAPASRVFLLECAEANPGLALDLGCGPGYTTHMISETLRPRRTVGLDRSWTFLDIARPTATESVSFIEHDVTEVPFPAGPADLIYCRFLLTHLANPEAQVAKWATQLCPGGLLLIDEVETIHTQNFVLRTYLDIVADMLRNQGNELYVGSLLDAMPEPLGLRQRINSVATFSPPARQAAGMFLMNLRVWRNGSFIRSSYSDEEVDRLESDLAALGGSEDAPEITWYIRQIAFQRA